MLEKRNFPNVIFAKFVEFVEEKNTGGVTLDSMTLAAVIAGPIILVCLFFMIVLCVIQRRRRRPPQTRPPGDDAEDPMMPTGQSLHHLLEEWSYSGSGSGGLQTSMADVCVPKKKQYCKNARKLLHEGYMCLW